MCNVFNIPVTVHHIKNVSHWHLGASLWGEPLIVCLLGGSYAGSLSELILARVTCAQAHSHYHEITFLTPDAYHVPQAFNKQELCLSSVIPLFRIFAIPKSVWKGTCGASNIFSPINGYICDCWNSFLYQWNQLENMWNSILPTSMH